jgi:hypothetical protein
MEPILPIDLPLVAPTPPARPAARRRRVSDEDRPAPRERDERPPGEDESDDDGDFPHVDVRV